MVIIIEGWIHNLFLLGDLPNSVILSFEMLPTLKSYCNHYPWNISIPFTLGMNWPQYFVHSQVWYWTLRFPPLRDISDQALYWSWFCQVRNHLQVQAEWDKWCSRLEGRRSCSNNGRIFLTEDQVSLWLFWARAEFILLYFTDCF